VIRVVVVDDQALVRRGIATILGGADDLEVAAEASDGLGAIELAQRTEPDVVIMDLRMPGLDGVGATLQLLRLPRPPRVLVLTTFDLDDYVVQALRAGASGYLLKDVEPAEMVAAVRAVAAGELTLAPQVLRRVVTGYVAGASDVADPRLTKLSDRELEVLRLLGDGLTNAEISARLVISLPTTKTHVGNILTKLDLRDRVQAAIFAHRSGLLGRRQDLQNPVAHRGPLRSSS